MKKLERSIQNLAMTFLERHLEKQLEDDPEAVPMLIMSLEEGNEERDIVAMFRPDFDKRIFSILEEMEDET